MFKVTDQSVDELGYLLISRHLIMQSRVNLTPRPLGSHYTYMFGEWALQGLAPHHLMSQVGIFTLVNQWLIYVCDTRCLGLGWSVGLLT